MMPLVTVHGSRLASGQEASGASLHKAMSVMPAIVLCWALGMPKASSISCASSISGNDNLLQVRMGNQFHNQAVHILHGIGEMLRALTKGNDRTVCG